jgi:hypothetical protein
MASAATGASADTISPHTLHPSVVVGSPSRAIAVHFHTQAGLEAGMMEENEDSVNVASGVGNAQVDAEWARCNHFLATRSSAGFLECLFFERMLSLLQFFRGVRRIYRLRSAPDAMS